MQAAKIIANGFGLVKSPRWHDDAIWFADWNAGQILRMSGAEPSPKTVASLASLPLSFDFLPDGSMVAVDAVNARLLNRDANGTFAIHTDLAMYREGLWNEIVVDGKGNCYINGPGLAMVDTAGKTHFLDETFAFANGMAILQDGKTLVIAKSHGHRLTAFDIDAHGTPTRRRVWAALGSGTPDGICADAEGHIWYADVPNQCCVRVREGGEVIEKIKIDRGAFACMLGGPDRRTLFITAANWMGMDAIAKMPGTGQLLAATVDVAGAGRP